MIDSIYTFSPSIAEIPVHKHIFHKGEIPMKQSPKKSSLPLRDDVRKLLSKFILMDDDFMRVVLKDIRCTEYILQTILKKPRLRVKEQVLQEDLKNLQGRSVILDCLCKDESGTIYNIELQNKRYGASPLRARYHAGMIDTHILKAGENFNRLPESYVIFICGKDVLKENRQIYHVKRIIEESGNTFPDKAQIIYINTEKSSDDELGRMIKDFYTEDPKEIRSKVLARRIAEIKIPSKAEKGEDAEMTTYYDRLKRQWKKEGKAEGIEQGINEGAANAEGKMAKLMGLLVKEGRIDDITRASESSTYRKALLEEFNLA